MQIYHGPCQITVTGIDADWPQRVVVRFRRGAEVVVAGVVGETYHVDADAWELALQHEVDGDWRENVRAIVTTWTPVDEMEQQVIRSKDRDWPGDRRERNLVVTLRRAVAGVTRKRVAEPAPGAPRAVVTQSSAEPPGVAPRSRPRTEAAAPAARISTTDAAGVGW